MNFLEPLALSLFALAIPLVLLYFIRVKSRQYKVSSLLLWDFAVGERANATLLQRLQLDPLLLLQLAALAAIAIAVARPSVTVMGEGDRKVVVVLDTSASMKARDVSPSRFARAQDNARKLIDSLRPGTKAMVVEAGIQPAVTAPMGTDHGVALDAISAAKAHDLPNGLVAALSTARALVGDDANAEIHVFTDGAFSELPDAEDIVRDARVRWSGVGGGDNNVGITMLSVRRNYQGAASHEAFVGMTNFSAKPQTFSLVVKVESRTVAEREVTLAAHRNRSFVFPFRHEGAGRVTAELKLSDDLAVDNVAWAVLPRPVKTNVTLVSQGNMFLEQVLRTDPEVNLVVKNPAQYAGGMGDADVVVLDSVTPPQVGGGRFIFVNTVPPDVPVDVLGTLAKPVVMDWDRNHPVMRNVEFSKVAITNALRLRPLASGRPLAEAELGGPLIYALEEPGRRAVLVGFDLFGSDLPLRVAFPLIMSNAVRWLHPVPVESQQFAAGQPLSLPVQQGVEAVTVSTPEGRSVPGKVARGTAGFSDTSEVGIYTLTPASSSGSRAFPVQIAANLMNSGESDIAPRPLPGSGNATASSAGKLVPVERELWPWFISLAILLLLIEAVLYWRRESRMAERLVPVRGAARAALALRLVTLGVLGGVFMKPVVSQSVDRMNVVFLLDASESLGASVREQGEKFMDAAVRTSRPGDKHGVIVFGADAAVDQPLEESNAAAPVKATVNAKGTNVHQAIQLALAMLPKGETNRIVLASDGNENAGNALAAAQAVKDSGAQLHYVAPAPGAVDQEVVAEELVLPQEVKFGEPFYARLVVNARSGGEGRVSLFRNGTFIGLQKVKLAEGKNVFAYRQSLDKDGIQIYQALIEANGDQIEVNNRAVGTVLVHGRPQVLIADRDRANAQSLAAALRAQQLEVTVVEPGGIPRDLASLQKYDQIFLSNVSAIQLDKSRMTLLRDYVRDYGGGLVMIGGDHSFGLGGYYQTPLEEALPVTMDVKQRVDVPNLSIVLAIDHSLSMDDIVRGKVTNLELAKEAAHMVVDLLDEQSEVGVVAWDHEFKWQVPMRRANNKQEIHAAISAITPGGGTDGLPALRAIYTTLAPRPAVLKHVIFLTDGQMRRDLIPEIVERMSRDQITVSSVAVGRFSDQVLLNNIARIGKGRFYLATDSDVLPRIFAVETQLASNSTVVDQPFKAQLRLPGHEAIQDIDWRSAPPLGGYVATTLKASAEQVLTSQWDDPVLATWRYGLGRTAAFTSDASSRWAGQWMQWRDFSKFWAQLARWTLKPATAGGTTATVSRVGRDGEVLVDVVDRNGAFVNFIDAEAGIVAPDRTRTLVDLEQVGPGRYRGRFPAAQEGVYLVGMARHLENQAAGSQVAGLVVPYTQELRDLGMNIAQLNEWSEVGGGGALKDANEVFLKGRKPYPISTGIWPWLAGVAAFLLFLDIALRRIGPALAGWFAGRRRAA